MPPTFEDPESSSNPYPIYPYASEGSSEPEKYRPEEYQITEINEGSPDYRISDIDMSIDRVIKGETTETKKTHQVAPPEIHRTTYSNQTLDSVISKNPQKAGTILKTNLETLRSNGENKITLKQLLSKNFQHYRSRPSTTSEMATEIVNKTLTENDVPVAALLSGLPPTSQLRKRNVYPQCEPIRTIESVLEDLISNKTDSGEPPSKFKKEELEDFPLMPPDPTAYPGNHLPFPVFWSSAPEFYTQSGFYLSIDNVRYTPMSDIMKGGKFLVPLDESVSFIFNEKPVEFTFNELLEANGVNLGQAQHYRMLQCLLQKAGVYIRADYAERLHIIQAHREHGLARKPQDQPILLTPDQLPLMCKHPEIYTSSLATPIHGAVLVDTSGEKEQLPFQTFLTIIYSEPLPLESRLQILILHDSEFPISLISERFGCSKRSVQETIGSRVLIDRHLVQQYFEDEMRPRSKIRRTHYVDLNKLVWKYFKECQASGIQINGKQLKDQAMRFAREMGLDSFRGSEGWLDAFKRRHRIDLKTMTGFPVCYESDMFEEVEREGQSESSPTLVDQHHNQNASLFPVAQHPSPDDFAASFFNQLTNFQSVPEPVAASSSHLQNMINLMVHASPPAAPILAPTHVSLPTPSTSGECSAASSDASEDPTTVLNVMRSCQIKVQDKDVSHALDTIRTYILANDPTAMNLLLPLQERLSLTAGTLAAVKIEPSTSSS